MWESASFVLSDSKGGQKPLKAKSYRGDRFSFWKIIVKQISQRVQSPLQVGKQLVPGAAQTLVS